MIFRVSLVQDVSHLDPVVSWLIGTSCFHFLLAKRKKRVRRAKAWKKRESYASLSRASLFPSPFCVAKEVRDTREGMEGKGLPRASSVSISF